MITMSGQKSKYRFCLMMPFQMSRDSEYIPGAQTMNQMDETLPKEKRLMNYEMVKHLLDDIEWDFHPGPPSTYGDWPVENREEFAIVAAGRLGIVREMCESGKYNAICLMGGGQPGLFEAMEIGRQYGIPVTGNATAQMHIATMLGNKFSIIDLSESHNMYYYNLVIQSHMERRCASIRNINFPLPRPGTPPGAPMITAEREKALRGEKSIAVERAIQEAVCAIQEDGAEVITFGCAATFWLRPFIEKGLNDLGYEVPVIDGYSAGIVMAKMLVDLGVVASGLWLPPDFPKVIRRKKVF